MAQPRHSSKPSGEPQESREEQLAHGGQQVAAQLGRIDLEQRGDRIDQRTDRQVAVARADERGQPRVDRHRAREPAALVQLDDARRLDAGQMVAGLGDVGRDDEDGCRERVVIEDRLRVVRRERVGVVRAERRARIERLRDPLVARERRNAS